MTSILQEGARSKQTLNTVNPVRIALLFSALFVVLMTLRDSGMRTEDALRNFSHSNLPPFEDNRAEVDSSFSEENLAERANPTHNAGAEKELRPVEAQSLRLDDFEETNNPESENEYRPPPCSKSAPGKQNFLMVFMGHSASSAILSELRQHSRFFVTVPEPIDHPPYEFNTELGIRYADQFFQNASSTGRISGFKMRPWHILHAPDEWRALIQKHNVRLIWQYRINVFKQAVGEYTARYMNDTSAIEGIDHTMTEEDRCKIGVGCQFRIDDISRLHDLMVNFVENNRQIQDAVRLLSDSSEEEQCMIPITYEDYLYDRENTMRKLLKFLDVDYEDHAPFRKKATSDNMCYALLNFQNEICKAFFKCSKWRSMLHDQRNSCTCSLAELGTSTSESFCPEVS